MDQYAAQNHGGVAGMMFIDIMTQPGNGPLRGSADFTFRDDGLNARNPFTPVKGVEQLKQGGLSMSGTIVPNKSSFSFTAQQARQYDSGAVVAALPGTYGVTCDSAAHRPEQLLREVRPGDDQGPHAAILVHAQ